MADLGKASYEQVQKKRTYGTRVVGLGDSITIGNVDLTNKSFGDNSWLQQFIVRSKGQARYVYNAGIAGNTTADMLARIQTDVIAKMPHLCIILGGTNDLYSVPIATTRANIEKMVQILIENSITPALCTVPPKNDTSTHAAVAAVNLTVVDLACKYGLGLIDFHSVLVNPATGQFTAGYTADGTHPNGLGSKQMSVKAVDVMSGYLKGFNNYVPSDNANPKNILSNGLFLNDTNADGIPDGWSAVGSQTGVTHSLVSDSAITGKWMRLVATVSATTYMKCTDIGPSTKYAVGDRLLITGRIKAVAEAGSMVYSVFIVLNGGGITPKPLASWTTDLDGFINSEFVIPSGTASIGVEIYINSGTGTLDVAQLGIFNLTQLGMTQNQY